MAFSSGSANRTGSHPEIKTRETDEPIRWLVSEFVPTGLFSLKSSQATSSVGQTLLVPTPYAIKMALVDVAFKRGLSEEACAKLLVDLIDLQVRVSPPAAAVVTHTFTKIRQQARKDNRTDPNEIYTSTIGYREFVHYQGNWRWAFDLSSGRETLAKTLEMLLPNVNYIGKRGSFIQFVGFTRAAELGEEFTQPLTDSADWFAPERAHIAILDDFGPEASLQTLSTFSRAQAKREKHRRFVRTIVPLGVINTGPDFTEYGSV